MAKKKNALSPDKEIELLFETSWEVCNKIGGIYTVLSTKAKELKSRFGDKLIFIGPDVWTEDSPSPVFIENKRLLKQAARFLSLPEGISIRTGRWDIPGSPIVVLIKFDGVYNSLDTIFGKMWENFGVDSLHAYGDYRESCAFAVASAIVINALISRLSVSPDHVLAHFDEWTTGMGLLYLQLTNPDVATIFTTHATSIGRSICGNGKPLYEYFHAYNGDQMAGELNMVSKHSLEKAAAHAADCFTTVSEVTAEECQQLLDIRPQVITPNGFDADFVPSEDIRDSLRTKGRNHILKIASLMSGKSLPEDTFIVATSGRNEFRNKGIDLFLDTMARLRNNPELLKKPILALILVPAWVKEPSDSIIKAIENNNPLPLADFMTHRLNNEDYDAIVTKIRNLGANSNAGNVTLMFVPCYLDGKDGIIDIPYYDLLPALDLTLFPSYYEPWGYTPLESVAFGIPTITTDKAGFGKWVIDSIADDMEASGVKVLPRNDSDYEYDVKEAASIIGKMTADSRPTLQKYSESALHTAAKASWALFISFYEDAFRIALKRRNLRLSKSVS